MPVDSGDVRKPLKQSDSKNIHIILVQMPYICENRPYRQVLVDV